MMAKPTNSAAVEAASFVCSNTMVIVSSWTTVSFSRPALSDSHPTSRQVAEGRGPRERGSPGPGAVAGRSPSVSTLPPFVSRPGQ